MPGHNVDIRRFVKFLKSPYGGKVPAQQICVLLNENATTANIKLFFNTFLKTAGKNDIIYFYYLSHGSRDKNKKGLFVTYDGYLRMDLIPKWFSKLEAKSFLGIISACYSGICVQDFKKYNWRKLDKKVAVIASSSKDRLSYYMWFKLGGFMGISMMIGLYGVADLNEDDQITVKELTQYLESVVNIKSLGYQKPVYYIEGLSDYVIANGQYWDTLKEKGILLKILYRLIREVLKKKKYY